MESNYTTLNDGTKMPRFGLGTYHLDKPEHKDVIKQGVKDLGYRMLDCASFYKNEELVGQALKELFEEKVVERKDLYIVSKVWWDEVDDVEAACKRSLTKLGVDQLDMYLIHWPIAMKVIENPDGSKSYERMKLPMHKIWEQMEALVDKGMVKSIGLSNFNIQLIWDMLSYCRIKPVTNEVELHPLNA